MRKREKKIFKIADATAQKSLHHYPMAAVIVKGGQIISKGFNQHKPRKIADGYFSTHAECHALCRAKNVFGADMYVYRVLKNGLPGLAKPCPLCETLIKKAGIYRVYYTVPTPPFVEVMRIG